MALAFGLVGFKENSMFISREEKQYLFEAIRLLQQELAELRSLPKAAPKKTWTEEEKKKRSDYLKIYHAKRKEAYHTKMKAEKAKA